MAADQPSRRPGGDQREASWLRVTMGKKEARGSGVACGRRGCWPRVSDYGVRPRTRVLTCEEEREHELLWQCARCLQWLEEQRFTHNQMQRKDARWCRKCEQEGAEKKQCNAPDGCFKFKTQWAFRGVEWSSTGERLCRHCANGQKKRKWGQYHCVQCGDQKPKKDFQNTEGKLTQQCSRKRLRCDVCLAADTKEKDDQEKQRMTEIITQDSGRQHKEGAGQDDEERFFTKQLSALHAWLSKHQNIYPKRDTATGKLREKRATSKAKWAHKGC